jgi:hypothetical protein
MSKSDAWENALLLLLFNNTNAANIGDATGLRGSTAAGSLYLSLHTADPGEAGADDQRVQLHRLCPARVARSSGGFTVTANSVSPAANVVPNPTNATNLSADGQLLRHRHGELGRWRAALFGALSPTIVISNTGVTPIHGERHEYFEPADLLQGHGAGAGHERQHSRFGGNHGRRRLLGPCLPRH